MKKITIGNCELYCGDAFEILPTLEDASIDTILSDPPYASESFGRCVDCSWDVPIPLAEFWSLTHQKTVPQANICLFCNMRFAYDLINTNLKNFRYELIWYKPNHRTGFLNSGIQPLRSHELILVFGQQGYRTEATYNAFKIPSGQPSIKHNRAKKGGVYPASEAYTSVSDGNKNPHSVLVFEQEKGSNQQGNLRHHTQKPLALMGWLVHTYSNRADTVLDPFMGSGTTALASAALGRKFIGIEKEPKFYDMACQRLEQRLMKWKAG